MLSPSLSQTLTLEDFLGQYWNNPRYELAEGEIIDLEPTGPRETVSGKLAFCWRVWGVIEHDLPPLKTAVQEMIETLDDS